MTLTIDQKKALLQEHFLLRHLSAADLAKLADRSEVKSYAADAPIFSRGDAAQ